MVNKVIERVLKIIRKDRTNTECAVNIYIEHNDTIYDRMSMKERVHKLIKENEKYFVYEIMRTTLDTIIHNDFRDIERLKTLGYSHRIAAETFEKYGIFLYTTDLSGYIYAPRSVRYELYKLIEEYGLDNVTEEIAIYLKENHSDKFGISIVSNQ